MGNNLISENIKDSITVTARKWLQIASHVCWIQLLDLQEKSIIFFMESPE